jgi:hypothetical protein
VRSISCVAVRLPHLGHVVVIAILAAPLAAAGQAIPIQLLFDGLPLLVTAEPEFACLDRARNTWIGCRIERETDGTRYFLSRPAPGEYTLHVKIDENKKNPARFPGDYDLFYAFEVTADAPAELNIDLPRLMRVKAPWDNDRDLNGMLARPWSEKPGFTISRSGVATVTFEWDAVVPDAEYTYSIVTARNDPYLEGAEILRGTTTRTKLTVQLPPSPPDHYFRFGISARKDERLVGDFMTHDSGVQSWAYTFVVRSAAAARVATRPRQSRTSDTARLEREFVAEWKQRVPKPAWWDDVPDSSLRIRSLGDLMTVWQSGTNDEASRRRFYKLTYEGIVERPRDEDLAAEGIGLMAYVADSDDRLPLLEFAVERFFWYTRRLDNCVNCLAGDSSGEMVRDLASSYISHGRHTEAIELIQWLVTERETEVSAYNLALTFETMSRAYWEMNDPAGAKAAIQEGLRRFPDGWQADQLRRTLERYEAATAAVRDSV